MSRPRCASACARSRCRRPPPSGPRSSREEIARPRGGDRDARSRRGSTSAAPSCGAAPRRPSSRRARSCDAKARDGSSPSALAAPRRSSPTPPGRASARRRRSTGSAPAPSGSRFAARRPRRSPSVCAPTSRRSAADAASGRPRAPSPAQLARAADEARSVTRRPAARVELARERLAALDRSLAEREGLPPAARALAEAGERLALSLLDVEPGARARRRGSARPSRLGRARATTPTRALALVERARAAGLGSLVVLVGRDPRELVRELRVVPLEELLASSVAARHDGGHRLGPRPRRALVRRRDRRGGAARARGAPRARSRPSSTSSRRAPRRPPTAAEAAATPPSAAAALGPHASTPIRPSSARLVAAPSGCRGARRRARRFEAPLRAASSTRAPRARPSSAPSCAASAPRRSSCAARPSEAAERLSRDRRRARAHRGRGRRGRAAVSTRPGAEPAEGDDRDELAERLERLERRREQLGQVNPLAKEEYEAEKERLDELAVAARRSRAEPRRAREAPPRADRDGRAPLRRDLRRGRAALRARSSRRSSPAARAGCA